LLSDASQIFQKKDWHLKAIFVNEREEEDTRRMLFQFRIQSNDMFSLFFHSISLELKNHHFFPFDLTNSARYLKRRIQSFFVFPVTSVAIFSQRSVPRDDGYLASAASSCFCCSMDHSDVGAAEGIGDGVAAVAGAVVGVALAATSD